MFVLQNKVYIFRLDKYWIFELNVDNKEKPLGPLIEGDIKTEDKWKGIDGNKNRFTTHENQIVAIDGHKWTEMQPNGQITKTENILPENIEPGKDDNQVNIW